MLVIDMYSHTVWKNTIFSLSCLFGYLWYQILELKCYQICPIGMHAGKALRLLY